MARSLTSLRLMPRWSPAAYVVLLGSAVAIAGLHPGLGVVSSLLAIAWVWTGRVPRRRALLAGAPLLLAVGVPWPAPALAASALFVVAEARSGRPVGGRTRLADSRGARAVVETVVAAAVCTPVAAVLARASWGNEHPVVELARPHPVVIAAGVALLALANALGEEWFWRGCAMRVLLDHAVGVRATILVQAASFGLAHAAGLPGGAIGVAGAAVLGVVLGVLRLRPAGMPGCVAVHTAVDVALFGLVANQVVWVG